MRPNPATLGTSTASGLAASHCPVLLDEEAEELTLLTNLGRPDEEVLEIDQGPLPTLGAGGGDGAGAGPIVRN
jgi:transcriptional regulator